MFKLRHRRGKPTGIWLVGAIVGLAFTLRIYRLAGQSIWYDEGLSIFYARHSLPDLMRLVLQSDHPPLFFLLLHGWLRLSSIGQVGNEWVVRYPAVFFGVLLVPLIYGAGTRLLGERTGRLAALLLAFSPMHVWYSQETRMYTLVTWLTVGATYVLWRLCGISRAVRPGPELVQGAQNPANRLFPYLGLYGLVMVLALYAHFYASLILIAHAVFITWCAWRRKDWTLWRRWSLTAVLVVGCFLPWGGLAAGQLRANDTYWRGTLALGRTLLQTVQAFAIGESVHGQLASLASLVYLALLGMGVFKRFWRTRRSEPGRDGRSETLALLLAWMGIPLLGLLVIAYHHPKFAPRYLLPILPATTLLVGYAAASLFPQAGDGWGRRAGRVVVLVLVGFLLGGRGLALGRYYTDPTQFKPDWRAVARYIQDHAAPADAVVIVAGHTMPAFDFYNTRRLDVYPVPPRLLPTVSDPIDLAEATGVLNQVVRDGHDRVWLVLWQEPLADPRRLVLSLLFEYGQRRGVNRNFHDLSLLLFDIPPGTVFQGLQPQHTLTAVFGDRLRLDGYDLSAIRVAAGETFTLRLYWQALRPMRRDYTVFTQLLSPDQKIIAQHDRRLGGDWYPTSHWPVGEPVRETYQLTVSPTAPPGSYRLITGVYLAPDGPRLPVQGNHAAGDHVLITDIEVK